jgi:hypothetical protein
MEFVINKYKVTEILTEIKTSRCTVRGSGGNYHTLKSPHSGKLYV